MMLLNAEKQERSYNAHVTASCEGQSKLIIVQL
jgi:hypothetical protein